jgi:predicted Zn-dependent peptidase
MKSLLTATLVLFLAGGVHAQKEQPLPKELPPYGPQNPLEAPDVKTTTLENGLTVWLVSKPGFPKAAFSISVEGGLAADPSDRAGLSELLAKALTQGTRTRSAKQIAEDIQAAGGDLSVIPTRDRTSVTTNVLSSKMEAALGILADILENAAFPDGEVAVAKKNASDELSQNEAQPGFQAGRALARVMFPGNPYSVVAPTQESLAQMTPAELRTEYARRFRPDHAVLVAVGDFETAKMAALIKEKLGGWKSLATPAVATAPKPSAIPPHAIYFIARPNSVQTTLVFAAFGPLRGDADYEAAEVANAIYGGIFSSRLVVNIREDKGYTYSPFAYIQTLRSAALVRTQADVRNAVTGASFNEISYEMNRLATTDPSDEELSKAKRFLLGIEAIQLQSREAVAGELANLWSNGLPPDEIGNYGKKIANASTADVDAAARKYYPASRMTVVAVGEEKVIRDSLAPFGLPIQPAP